MLDILCCLVVLGQLLLSDLVLLRLPLVQLLLAFHLSLLPFDHFLIPSFRDFLESSKSLIFGLLHELVFFFSVRLIIWRAHLLLLLEVHGIVVGAHVVHAHTLRLRVGHEHLLRGTGMTSNISKRVGIIVEVEFRILKLL